MTQEAIVNRRLVVSKLTSNFREATEIIEEVIHPQNLGKFVVKNFNFPKLRIEKSLPFGF